MPPTQQGRCAGCGAEGTARRIQQHAASCADYARLYREHPERALSPEAEWRREHSASAEADRAERTANDRADAKDRIRAKLKALAEDRNKRQQERWNDRVRRIPATPTDPPSAR